MTKTFIHSVCSLLFVSMISFSSCKASKVKDPAPTGSPVESEPPHTDYPPAFSGQTRAPGIKTKTALQVEVIAKDLNRPWGIASMPNGNLLITEKSGRFKIFGAEGDLVSVVTGLPPVVDKGQGGLLDVVLDPDFEQNRILYWSYSEPFENGNLTAVAKGRLSKDESQIEFPTVIFRAIPAYDGNAHFGSRLVFDNDGYLFVSTGERSDLVTRPLAQSFESGLGKVLKISKNGEKAPTNPFSSSNDTLAEIYSLGHRNVQGLALHPETGELWSSEMGPMGGDELNLIKSGKNYGWPIITYGLEYSGKKIGEGITQKEGLEQPVYYWDPSISPSGITFYTGEIEEWRNDLFIGCLSGQHIIRLKIKGNRVIGEERLLEDHKERFRDVQQGINGKLYAITDSGKLYRISQKQD